MSNLTIGQREHIERILRKPRKLRLPEPEPMHPATKVLIMFAVGVLAILALTYAAIHARWLPGDKPLPSNDIPSIEVRG